MALKHKELKDKLEKTPLTPEELFIIDHVEKYIDEEIKKQFKGGSVSIDLLITNFEYNISRTTPTNYPYVRKKLMSKELDRRYKESGWKISHQIDDGLDGPNMSGNDYWVISGK